ncbi:hypothetical protein [Streptomyces sp. NPDC056169]|uniref:hypothetical protein n=1 Tax=Streptomyces sp. NPDC056169 TaxID=3345734 RepID=UPI0035D74AF6
MKQRPANSRVNHGDPACADYGCKREECLQSRRRVMKQREYLAQTGRSCLTGTDRTGPHIARLRGAGMTDAAIQNAARIGRDALYKAARPGGAIARATETKILAIALPSVMPRAASINRARVDGRSTRLRLQALTALGWPQYVIANAMGGGTTSKSLSRLMLRMRRGDRYVSLSTAQKAQRAYEQLWNQDPLEHGVFSGAVVRAKATAAAEGWRRPMDLDDDVLDDPGRSRVVDISPHKKSSPRTSVSAAPAAA